MKSDTDERVAEAFAIFDKQNDKTIAISEVPTLIRVLGVPIKESDFKPFSENWKNKAGKLCG